VSRLSRQCGILNIKQPYRPPRPVTRIAILYLFKFTSHRNEVQFRIIVPTIVYDHTFFSSQFQSLNFLIRGAGTVPSVHAVIQLEQKVGFGLDDSLFLLTGFLKEGPLLAVGV
jgi:hypothetical protein